MPDNYPMDKSPSNVWVLEKQIALQSTTFIEESVGTST